jgi:DNA invertase Pin-like site-specific DNA recombinase
MAVGDRQIAGSGSSVGGITEEGIMSVYGYVRVSTIKQVDNGDSLEAQRRQIEGYAQMRDLKIDHVFVEEGVSGSIPVTQRPKGGPLLDVLVKGDVLVAAKLDRLFRSALDALRTVEDLNRRGVSLHLLDLGGDVSASGMAKLFLTVAAAFAEAERDRIRERTQQTCSDLKRQGKRVGGGVPFGYRAVPAPDGRGELLVPHEPEQQLIKRVMAPMRGKGASFRRIAEVAREKGFEIGKDAVIGALKRHEESK